MGESRGLVIGAGSIGLRHQRVLEGLGVVTDLVTRRPGVEVDGRVRIHMSLADALREVAPDYVVIATETASHLRVLRELAREGFRGRAMVEKPLASEPVVEDLSGLPFRSVAVGYQLRFHPAVTSARAVMAEQRILAVDAYVGQHLAAWRPGRSVGDTASARLEDGGGVLRDLSHELDLVTWLAGSWRRACAAGGRSGALGADVATDDRWAIALELEDGTIVTVQLNALDHVGQRRITLVGERNSVAVDLVAATVVHRSDADLADRAPTVEQHPAGRDEVLAVMHAAALAGDTDQLCSLDEGISVVQLIDAVERSAQLGAWVDREDVR